MYKRSQNRKPVVKKRDRKHCKTIKTDDIRLDKYIANSGMCSRRDADVTYNLEQWSKQGVVTKLIYKVKPGEIVNFDGAWQHRKKRIFVWTSQKTSPSNESRT
jgi:23S rRNA pseudouridine2605 synthase